MSFYPQSHVLFLISQISCLFPPNLLETPAYSATHSSPAIAPSVLTPHPSRDGLRLLNLFPPKATRVEIPLTTAPPLLQLFLPLSDFFSQQPFSFFLPSFPPLYSYWCLKTFSSRREGRGCKLFYPLFLHLSLTPPGVSFFIALTP